MILSTSLKTGMAETTLPTVSCLDSRTIKSIKMLMSGEARRERKAQIDRRGDGCTLTCTGLLSSFHTLPNTYKLRLTGGVTDALWHELVFCRLFIYCPTPTSSDWPAGWRMHFDMHWSSVVFSYTSQHQQAQIDRRGGGCTLTWTGLPSSFHTLPNTNKLMMLADGKRMLRGLFVWKSERM